MDGQKLRTQFVASFTAEFIGPPTKIKDPGSPSAWPDPEPDPADPNPKKTRVWPDSEQTTTSIVDDYATFVNVLMTIGYVGAGTPTGPNATLAAKILQFLNQNPKWPSQTAVPAEYASEKPTVHLVEIGVILDRLLQAINSFNASGGPAGGGSGWPPH